MKLVLKIRRFLASEDGPTAVEYGRDARPDHHRVLGGDQFAWFQHQQRVQQNGQLPGVLELLPCQSRRCGADALLFSWPINDKP